MRTVGTALRRLGRGVTLLAVVAGMAGPAGAQEATPVPQAAAVPPYTPPEGIGSVGGTIEIDGSSTVFPITDETRIRFEEFAGNLEIRGEISGTGGGFRRFCDGDIDIANASRPIEADEIVQCAENGVRYYRFDVAYDGVTIAVNPANDFVTCLTLDQLRQLWRPDDPAETWHDLDPAWPDDEINLYGPGHDSGTFDYFTAVVMGEEDLSTDDYFPSEDDNVLVTGVADDEDALGYFGYAYYAASQDNLTAVAVDAGGGCVLPTPQTIADGSYSPLSRPLFIYVRIESLARQGVVEFVRYYLASAREIVPEVYYVPLSDADYAAQQAKFEGALTGAIPPDGP